jgi:hypothetical protein
MQSIAPHSNLVKAVMLVSATVMPWKVQASLSGMNNIPAADTVPDLILVLQEYSKRD